MKRIAMVLGVAAGIVMMAGPVFGQGEKEGQGSVVVTVLPKHAGDASADVSAQAGKLKVNGKETDIASLVPLKGDKAGLELVVLLDSGSRTSLGSQLDELGHFLASLPPNVKVAVAYMRNGQAVLTGPLTADHAAVARMLHIPAGSAGSNGSPYFCLSDLAKHWPSSASAEGAPVRREVVMLTDGLDEYSPRFDPEDPYMQAAIQDSVRAGLVVYAIYWRGQGRYAASPMANDAGQNLLSIVTQATGGKSFWIGGGNPVSLQPFLEELSRRFQNQYELSFVTHFNGKAEVEQLKLKLSVPGSDVSAPERVFVMRPGLAQN